MRRDFFSTSVARPPGQQLAAITAPVLVPSREWPAHAPACSRSIYSQVIAAGLPWGQPLINIIVACGQKKHVTCHCEPDYEMRYYRSHSRAAPQHCG